MTRVYEGQVPFLGEDIAFSVSSMPMPGGELRELQLRRTPLMPSELLKLMNVVAPVPSDDIRDIKLDMAVAVDVGIYIGDGTDKFAKDTRMNHRAAFTNHWATLTNQARDIFDALPYRFTGVNPPNRVNDAYRPAKSPKSTKLRNVIGTVSNKAIRDSYFERLRAGEELAAAPIADSDGYVRITEAPFVKYEQPNGTIIFGKRGALKFDECGDVLQHPYGATPDGLVTVLDGGRAVWESYRVPKIGITPTIRWARHADGKLTFEHEPGRKSIEIWRNYTWGTTSSTVVGTLALAAMNPEISAAWAPRQGYKYDPEASPRDGQTMGPLQALMLSVITGDKLLHGPLVQHVENILDARL